MACECDPDSYPEFYEERQHTARLAFTCCECRVTRPAGTRYRNISGKWDGLFMAFKTCSYCLDLEQWVKNNMPCFCYSFGEMRSEARNDLREVAEYDPGSRGLYFGFLRRAVLTRAGKEIRP